MFKLSYFVKNVILGCQNVCEVAEYYSKLRNGFSQLAVQRSGLTRPDNHDYVERRLSNLVKDSLPRGIDKVSSEFPAHCKWLDKVHTKPICTPALPWKSSNRSYYERKDPKCPPKDTELHPCKEETPKIIPAPPECPVLKPACRQCYEPKLVQNPCPGGVTKKRISTFSLNTCRFYCGACKPPSSGNPCGSKKGDPCANLTGGKKGGGPCEEIRKSQKGGGPCGGSKGGDPCGGLKR